MQPLQVVVQALDQVLPVPGLMYFVKKQMRSAMCEMMFRQFVDLADIDPNAVK